MYTMLVNDLTTLHVVTLSLAMPHSRIHTHTHTYTHTFTQHTQHNTTHTHTHTHSHNTHNTTQHTLTHTQHATHMHTTHTHTHTTHTCTQHTQLHSANAHTCIMKSILLILMMSPLVKSDFRWAPIASRHLCKSLESSKQPHGVQSTYTDIHYQMLSNPCTLELSDYLGNRAP